MVSEALTLPERQVDGAAWGRPARLVLGSLYGVFFVQQALTVGIPFDRWRLIAWILVGMLISCVGRTWRRLVQLLVDWLPFIVLLVAYAYSARLARWVSFPIQRESVLWFEKAMFFGNVPSIELQRLLLPDAAATPVRWWEVGISFVYASHFLLPYALAGWLWVKDRTAYLVYAVQFTIVTGLAVVCFVLLPTAPPWMLSEQGLMDDTFRPVGRGWRLTPLHAADTWLTLGRRLANPVAAMPSLHTAFATLVAYTLWRRTRNRVARTLLLAYPFAMGFTLVYGSEHWVSDVVAGMALVFGAVKAQQWLAPRWRSWHPLHAVATGINRVTRATVPHSPALATATAGTTDGSGSTADPADADGPDAGGPDAGGPDADSHHHHRHRGSHDPATEGSSG